MILGIDWGRKKIGLAIASKEISIASALKIIENDEFVFDILKDVIEEYDIELIIMGKSEHLSQTDNKDEIEKFGIQCQNKLNVDVQYITEMFSTREAQSNLIEAGKKHISKYDDAEAARIILQQYMDAENTKV